MARLKTTTLGVGGRIREFRQARHMSQGDIEERSGLLRCYISRVENGHTVPSIETLERFASALEVPMFKFLISDGHRVDDAMTRGDEIKVPLPEEADEGARFIRRLRQFVPFLTRRDQKVLLDLAKKMADK